jgi:hypothetical protein
VFFRYEILILFLSLSFNYPVSIGAVMQDLICFSTQFLTTLHVNTFHGTIATLPSLQTLHLSGFDILPYFTFTDLPLASLRQTYASRMHEAIEQVDAKIAVYASLFQFLISAAQNPKNRFWKLTLSHGSHCGDFYACFWEDLEVLIRKSTKRVSYVDDFHLDTDEEHVYVYELGERDGSGIAVKYSIFEVYKQAIYNSLR